MLELVASRVAIVGCLAAPEAVDAAVRIEGAYACRVAPDEVLLVGEAGSGTELVRAATVRVSADDPDAVVVDATDGWAAWTLAGDAAREAFARLSELPLPDEGFAQGDVAHVPVKVIAFPGRLHLLVPAMWGEHLRERVLDLGLPVRERPEPAAWTAPGGRPP